MSRKRRTFSAEFKAQAVDLVRQGGKSFKQLAKDLDLTETCLRDWVKAAEGTPRRAAVQAHAVAGGVTRENELESLRREVRQLRMERDFLKKAAAFFAKENA